jgi:O-antigen ligase
MNDGTATGGWIVFLQAFALAAVVAGFPLVAALSQIIDMPSQPFSIAIRGVTALFCAVLLIVSVSPNRNAIWWWTMAACLGFWLAYVLRMTNDTLLKSYSLFYEPSSYWLWAIGGSIIPLFGLARGRYQSKDASHYFNWCFAFAFGAALLALPNLSTTVQSDYGAYDGGRAALTALNPISLGHLGVQLVLLSLWALFLRPDQKLFLGKLMFSVALVVGVYLALVANSRGPLVSLVIALLFAVVASNLRSKYWIVGLILAGAVAFVPMVTLVDHIAGTQIYERLLGSSQFDEVSTLGRIDLYASAWSQFTKFPLTGYGLEDPVFGGYPHNLVIEAFMATGLFGGLLMITILILTVVASYRTLRKVPGFGWLALLVIQQIFAAQFSGTISQATILWGVVGALVSVYSLVAINGRPRNSMIEVSSRNDPGFARGGHLTRSTMA